jgi:hypothetical protein
MAYAYREPHDGDRDNEGLKRAGRKKRLAIG